MSLNASRYGRRPERPADDDPELNVSSTLRPGGSAFGERRPCVVSIYARLIGVDLGPAPVVSIAESVLGLRGLRLVCALNDLGRFREAWSAMGEVLFESPLGAEYRDPGDPPLGLGDRIEALLAGLRGVEALRQRGLERYLAEAPA